jgi:hypothetical protein
MGMNMFETAYQFAACGLMLAESSLLEQSKATPTADLPLRNSLFRTCIVGQNPVSIR